MFDFFNKLFKPVPPSGATAKERLRLVLLSDHLSLAPEVIEALKRDLLAVISRYMEIDGAHADVTFEHRENEVAMLASIPITGMRERSRDTRPLDAEPEPELEPALAPAAESAAYPEPVQGDLLAAGALADDMEPDDVAGITRGATAHAAEADAQAMPVTKTKPAAAGAPRRRRRRKSSAAKRATQQTVQFNKPAQA